MNHKFILPLRALHALCVSGIIFCFVFAACEPDFENAADFEAGLTSVTRVFAGTIIEVADSLKTDDGTGKLLSPVITRVVAYTDSKRIGQFVFSAPSEGPAPAQQENEASGGTADASGDGSAGADNEAASYPWEMTLKVPAASPKASFVVEFMKVDEKGAPFRDGRGDNVIYRTDIADNKDMSPGRNIELIVISSVQGLTLETLSKIGQTPYDYNFLEDIDLLEWYGKDGNPEYWEPIDYPTNTGTLAFSGNGKTISNLRLKGGDVENSGFFGKISTDMPGSDLTIELDPDWAVELTGTKEEVNIGPFAAYAERMKFRGDITVKGSLTVIDNRTLPADKGVINVGGVIGDFKSFKTNNDRTLNNYFEGGHTFVDISVTTAADDVRVGGYVASYRGLFRGGRKTHSGGMIVVNADSRMVRVGALIGISGNPYHGREYGGVVDADTDGTISVVNKKEGSVNYVSGLVAYISDPDADRGGSGPFIRNNESKVSSITLETAEKAENHAARILAGYQDRNQDPANKLDYAARFVGTNNKASAGMTLTVNDQPGKFERLLYKPAEETIEYDLFNGIDMKEDAVVEAEEEAL
jgi:hypothetical protein